MPVTLHRSQRGFSLIEVLVAITILLVGVLGVVALVDTSNAVTSRTKSREGANNVARSAVEVSRAVPYRSLTAVELVQALDSRPGLADALPGLGHTISSRGFFYDVEVQVCSMDDPKDNLGIDDGTVEFCPESDHAPSSSAAKDRNPDDYKRIAVTLSWQRQGSTETVKQTSLVSNPVGGLGPTVIRLDAPAVTGTPKTVISEGPVSFEAETSTDASELSWSIDGAGQGLADPVGSSMRKFEFTWDIEGSSGGRQYEDCTYVIQAEAFDDKGRAGSPKALTIVLNRARAKAPGQFEGGRNGSGTAVDLSWKKNLECDVLGYRVYRSTVAGGSTGGPWTPVTCAGQLGSYVEDLTCIDDDAPASDPLHYYVVGVDTAPGSGAPLDGAPSYLTVTSGNSVPTQPTNVSACVGGTPGCTEPDGTPASDAATVIRWDPSTDPDPGDSILFYRIYRDGFTYTDRYGTFFPDATGALAWT
ncbi:MAG: prepilin-type N-terminal cleavage/methylation domain-containing protein, partial [Pseudonocardiaceae bacterium]